MEFKGTKGRWVIKDYRQETVLSLSKDRKDIIIAECGNVYDVTGNYHRTHEDEQNANALLISKAPEMLEMLQYILKEYKEGGEFSSFDSQLIENLIKQATEL